jgi:SAM-dependent methyltransferase
MRLAQDFPVSIVAEDTPRRTSKARREGSAIAGPRVNQALWRITYEYLAARIPLREWAFMNYGYAAVAPAADTLELDASDEEDRFCIQLYERVAGPVDLHGRDVLEIGSGRGGGASYIKRYLGPATVVGADLSRRAVRLCNRYRALPGLRYVHGDALSLPFPDGSFDAVVNVESSHCYPSMDAFLVEVHRVLRPGGHFLFADFRSNEELGGLQDEIARCPLEVVEEEVITGNVVAALERDSERKLRLIRQMVPTWLHGPFTRFAAIEGSQTHEGFLAGRTRYLRYVLRKPA